MKVVIGPLRVTGADEYLRVRWRAEAEPPVAIESAESRAWLGSMLANLMRHGVVLLAGAVAAGAGGAALVAAGHRGWGLTVVAVGVVLTVLAVFFLAIGAAVRSWRRGRWVPLSPEASALFAVTLAEERARLGPAPTDDQREAAAARLWRRAVDLHRTHHAAGDAAR